MLVLLYRYSSRSVPDLTEMWLLHSVRSFSSVLRDLDNGAKNSSKSFWPAGVGLYAFTTSTFIPFLFCSFFNLGSLAFLLYSASL